MDNSRPTFDQVIQDIADYALSYEVTSELALDTAYYDLLDSIACALQALNFPACTKLLGPTVPGATFKNGVKVWGTQYELEPVQAAFNLGALIRWLDFNDTWLAAEWGHPSDNIGGIIAAADYLNRHEGKSLTVHDVLIAMIKAHEIQGVLALENSFNRVGLDHVILVKVATTAVVAAMLGCDREQTCNAISLAWLDGQSLRTYRHSPNTGSRKSWAAGDATSRGVRLALMARLGEMGYPSALTAPTWGFYDVSFKGKSFKFPMDYSTYVMENILFKISFPAEFHSQTAVECAFTLHREVKDRLDEIERIDIETQEPSMRILDKTGPLNNPADRDHCMQYIVAIGLIFGELEARHYDENIAADKRIDSLRKKMHLTENKEFTDSYYNPEKRAIPNAIAIHFSDGSKTERICVEYPIGHRKRREEGIPVLLEKFKSSVNAYFPDSQAKTLLELSKNRTDLEQIRVDFLQDRLIKT